MNSKNEENYWREHHRKQPFVKPGHTHEYYSPAYRTGSEGFHKCPGKKIRGDRARSIYYGWTMNGLSGHPDARSI